jgi:hypothetical protein
MVALATGNQLPEFRGSYSVRIPNQSEALRCCEMKINTYHSISNNFLEELNIHFLCLRDPCQHVCNRPQSSRHGLCLFKVKVFANS